MAKAQVKKPLFSKTAMVVIIFLFLLSLSVAGFFAWQYFQLKQKVQNPTQVELAEAEALIKKVGRLIVLPDNEQPTIATVTDKTKLNDRDFFQKAQNNDKVIVFQKAKKAILYRPSINKIIEVSSINLQVPSPTIVPFNKSPRVAIYNATSTPGYATTAEKQFKELLPNLNVVVKANPSLNIYTESQIIDLTGKNQDWLNFASAKLDLLTAQLQPGEATPAADILIIVTQ